MPTGFSFMQNWNNFSTVACTYAILIAFFVYYIPFTAPANSLLKSSRGISDTSIFWVATFSIFLTSGDAKARSTTGFSWKQFIKTFCVSSSPQKTSFYLKNSIDLKYFFVKRCNNLRSCWQVINNFCKCKFSLASISILFWAYMYELKVKYRCCISVMASWFLNTEIAFAWDLFECKPG